MKKGLTYVDIAISVGIFVIYGLFVFIIFKPAIEEEYDGDYLTSIVKDGITKDGSWSVSKLPIFLDTNLGMDGKTIFFEFPFDWDEKSLYMYDETGEVNFDIGSGSPPTLVIPFKTAWLGVAKKEFTLVYTGEAYTWFTHGSYTGDFDAQSFASIGVVDDLFGLQKFTDGTGIFFDNIVNKPYNELKEDWNYPKKKEFYVEIGDGASLLTIGEKPLTDKKVNILTFTSFFLNEKGEKQLVVVKISAW